MPFPLRAIEFPIFFSARCDLKMAERCLQLALASDADHAESLVNLGILKMHDRRTDEARTLFQMAAQKGPHLYEAHFNSALLLHEARQHQSFI